MTKLKKREKGYSRASDIPLDVQDRLNKGLEESLTLSEITAIDMVTLIKENVKSIPASDLELVDSSKGILKKMKASAEIISKNKGFEYYEKLRKSKRSDTLRGIGAFIVGANKDLSPKSKIELLTPFIKDSHFGVREWAWMAVRDDISESLSTYIGIFENLSTNEDIYVRRFCSESTRPKGVWAKHLNALKTDPDLALGILDNLYRDEARYVQDSVANWMNDLNKVNPGWVVAQCKKWQKSGNEYTDYIIKKSLRNIQ